MGVPPFCALPFSVTNWALFAHPFLKIFFACLAVAKKTFPAVLQDLGLVFFLFFVFYSPLPPLIVLSILPYRCHYFSFLFLFLTINFIIIIIFLAFQSLILFFPFLMAQVFLSFLFKYVFVFDCFFCFFPGLTFLLVLG